MACWRWPERNETWRNWLGSPTITARRARWSTGRQLATSHWVASSMIARSNSPAFSGSTLDTSARVTSQTGNVPKSTSRLMSENSFSCFTSLRAFSARRNLLRSWRWTSISSDIRPWMASRPSGASGNCPSRSSTTDREVSVWPARAASTGKFTRCWARSTLRKAAGASSTTVAGKKNNGAQSRDGSRFPPPVRPTSGNAQKTSVLSLR